MADAYAPVIKLSESRNLYGSFSVASGAITETAAKFTLRNADGTLTLTTPANAVNNADPTGVDTSVAGTVRPYLLFCPLTLGLTPGLYTLSILATITAGGLTEKIESVLAVAVTADGA